MVVAEVMVAVGRATAAKAVVVVTAAVAQAVGKEGI